MGIDICEELSQNFIDFSYEANSERAFPDVRDGNKPVQRACLWEMYTRGYNSSKPHVKSAKISGGVISLWSPHGEQATYETFVRMSQDWINNIPEVDFHGGNGNVVISASPAASRYTEARLSKAAEDGLFMSMNKHPVPMKLNFSEDAEMPVVLPAIFPRLVINGSQGIGSTIANWWELNNLNEITDAIVNYINTSTIDYSKIYPDFPSGGIIINKDDIHEIYETGKGKIVLRGRAIIDDNTITITELPYQIYVEPFINEIKTLIEKDQISGIDEIYNKSDDKGIKIEIVCSKPANKVLKRLYKTTSLEKTFSPNHMALLGKTPKMFTLSQYFDEYIKHNLSCIVNEYKYDLNENEKRFEIVQGLVKALGMIDTIIATIKASASSTVAQKELIDKFNFTENQAKAIVDMRLGRLAHLELAELQDEMTKLEETIKKINKVLSSIDEQKAIFINRLTDFTKKYGFKRRTEIIDLVEEPDDEEDTAVEPDNCVIITTESGYIKRIAGDIYKASKKVVKSTDDIVNVITTNTADNLLVFSNKGKLYRLPVLDIPEGTGKGVLIKLLASMEPDEMPSTIYSSVMDYNYIMFITQNGMIKKSKLTIYETMKKAKGAPVISFVGADKIATILLLKEEPIAMITKQGQFLYCETKEINPTGKTARGIKGFKVADKDVIVSAVVIRDPAEKIAIITNNGYAKRVNMSEFALRSSPGGKGQIAYKPTDKTGEVADAQIVNDEDSIFIVGDNNVAIVDAKDIPIARRTTMGSIVINDNNKINTYKVKS